MEFQQDKQTIITETICSLQYNNGIPAR